MTLHLRDTDRRRLLAASRAEHPREACGLLLGESASDGARVLELIPGRNVEAERPATRFELSPEDFLRADARAREAGLEILGVWHSHPAGGAEPSDRDRIAAQPGWRMLIAGLRGRGGAELRAWRLEGGRLVEEALAGGAG